MNNAVFTDNIDYAIYHENGKINLTNVVISAPTDGNANAIYNSAGAWILTSENLSIPSKLDFVNSTVASNIQNSGTIAFVDTFVTGDLIINNGGFSASGVSDFAYVKMLDGKAILDGEITITKLDNLKGENADSSYIDFNIKSGSLTSETIYNSQGFYLLSEAKLFVDEFTNDAADVQAIGVSEIKTLMNTGTFLAYGATTVDVLYNNAGKFNPNGVDIWVKEAYNKAEISAQPASVSKFDYLDNQNLVKSYGSTTFGTVVNTGTIKLNFHNNFDTKMDYLTGNVSGTGILDIMAKVLLNGDSIPEISSTQIVDLQNTAILTIQKGTMNFGNDDIWSGSVVMNDDNATLKYSGLKDNAVNGQLVAEKGTISASASTLTIANSSAIAEPVELSLADVATLDITGGSVTLDSDDNWLGTVKLSSGDLIVTKALSGNGKILADGGVIDLQAGDLTIGADSYIKSATQFNLAENSTLTVNGANAYLSVEANDVINGSVKGVTGAIDISNREILHKDLSIDSANKSDVAVKLTGVTVNLQETTPEHKDFVLGQLTVGEDSVFKLDVNTENREIDTITVGTGATGTILIKELAGLDTPTYNESFVLNVLSRTDSADENGIYSINLKLDENLVANNLKVYTVESYLDGAEYKVYDNTFIGKSGIDLTEDKAGIVIGVIELRNTLREVNIFDNPANTTRSYNFSSAKTILENESLGVTGSGIFTVNGATTNAAESVIDMSAYDAFNLEKATIININNLTIQNAGTALKLNNVNAVANVNNVVFKDNVNYAIYIQDGNAVFENVIVSAPINSKNNAIYNASGNWAFEDEFLRIHENVIFINSTISSDIENSGAMELQNTSVYGNVISNNGGLLNLYNCVSVCPFPNFFRYIFVNHGTDVLKVQETWSHLTDILCSENLAKLLSNNQDFLF